MRILLTNDDGVHAEGIQALRRALEKVPGIELYVVAPERERSASSHAITLHKPLYVSRVQMEGARSPMWAVSGTPADCTKIAVSALLDHRPDLVISGINRGPNLGTDVLYSGTVSAAIEAVIAGIPAVAVSLVAYGDADFEPAARFMALLVSTIVRQGNPGFTLLNVNIPALDLDQMAGVAVTRLSRRRYSDSFVQRTDPRGRTYYWLAGELLGDDDDPATDAGAVQQNLISLTPLHLELTDSTLLPGLADWASSLDQRLRPNDTTGRS
ncbi:MAG: 5'/3'-nucleotidase SurE [Thermaerobacter sp.]|nr:5'/3'-nucleotidase SurE [Bacillota bacterium]REJ35914.1 MAG: 5'/3'-nucleotidase SurE [Bacillota bacterium]